MSHYLIKRSNAFRELHRSNSKSKGYFEITISKRKLDPPSASIRKGDTVFVAETSGGIYAKGTVVKTNDVAEFSRIEDVLVFSKKFKDEAYWMDKVRTFSQALQKDENYRLRCHEYFIKQQLLRKTVPYNGPLSRYDASVNKGLATIFFKLTSEEVHYLNDSPDLSLKEISGLRPEIPGDLRLKIYSFFNRNHAISHLIDIDHFVPKSLGGPGNIIENLVPVGLSLNRYKNDSIPRAFFVVAAREEYQAMFSEFKRDIDVYASEQIDFIKTKKFPVAKKIAIAMNDQIRGWAVVDARRFYLEVNKRHNPRYAEHLKLLEQDIF